MSGTASTDRTSGSHYRLSNGSNRILFPGKLFNEFVLVCITQEGLQPFRKKDLTLPCIPGDMVKVDKVGMMYP